VQHSRRRFLTALPFAALSTFGCWSPAPPGPAGAFRFAVFGDGPYSWDENGRFRRLVDALNQRPLAFVIHVGDIMWQKCTDEAYRARLEAINRIRHPVIYTPGDNEWTDCISPSAGGYLPLGRLASLRKIFFDHPDKSLGGTTIALETQSANPLFAEFPEHARWFYGGVMFMTMHVVGSANGAIPFRGRTAKNDEEVKRRTDAAVVWLYDSFQAAVDRKVSAAVVAFHGDIFFKSSEPEYEVYAPIYNALVDMGQHFPKPILVVHGDGHRYTVDRPFRDPGNGAGVERLQRLETFGSPDIGWVDVVVDTARPERFRFEPNVLPGWMLW
jgi:hypothetical protein